jgi:hypothetical protein
MKSTHDLAREAGFYLSDIDIFSPHKKENITLVLQKFAKLLSDDIKKNSELKIEKEAND